MSIRATLLFFWALALIQILTVSVNERYTLLEPLTTPWLVALILFVATSLGHFPIPARKAFIALHLLVVAVLALAHPLTVTLGRDGSVAVISIYGLLVLWLRTAISGRCKLLLSSLVASFFLVEASLTLVRAPRPAEGVLDYGDVMGAYGEGGFLRPKLNVRVVGERGDVEFVTERHGFRNREDVPQRKPASSFRIYFVGDSFVAGYRVGQEQTVGRRLESSLRARTKRQVDVIIAGAGYPGVARNLVSRHALDFEPDLVLVGITLGNDMFQSWKAHHPTRGDAGAVIKLPAVAFDRSWTMELRIRLDRSLSAWRIYRRILRHRAAAFMPWYPVLPGEVSLFDPGHALGYFFVRRRLALVDASYVDLFRALEGIRASCRSRKIDVVFAVFPQRFQVSEADWNATVFAYGLDRAAFELGEPNRRIRDECGRRGLACIDLLPAFRRRSDEVLYLPRGDMHWNSRGHAVAAEALAEELQARVQRYYSRSAARSDEERVSRDRPNMNNYRQHRAGGGGLW